MMRTFNPLEYKVGTNSIDLSTSNDSDELKRCAAIFRPAGQHHYNMQHVETTNGWLACAYYVPSLTDVNSFFDIMIDVWDVQNKSHLYSFRAFENIPDDQVEEHFLLASPDNHIVMTLKENGGTKIWDLTKRKLIKEIDTGYIEFMGLDEPEKNLVFAYTMDKYQKPKCRIQKYTNTNNLGIIYIYLLQTGPEKLGRNKYALLGQNKIAICTSSEQIEIWDIVNQKIDYLIKGKSNILGREYFEAIIPIRKNYLAIIFSEDLKNKLLIWNVEKRQIEFTMSEKFKKYIVSASNRIFIINSSTYLVSAGSFRRKLTIDEKDPIWTEIILETEISNEEKDFKISGIALKKITNIAPNSADYSVIKLKNGCYAIRSALTGYIEIFNPEYANKDLIGLNEVTNILELSAQPDSCISQLNLRNVALRPGDSKKIIEQWTGTTIRQIDVRDTLLDERDIKALKTSDALVEVICSPKISDKIHTAEFKLVQVNDTKENEYEIIPQIQHHDNQLQKKPRVFNPALTSNKCAAFFSPVVVMVYQVRDKARCSINGMYQWVSKPPAKTGVKDGSLDEITQHLKGHSKRLEQLEDKVGSISPSFLPWLQNHKQDLQEQFLQMFQQKEDDQEHNHIIRDPNLHAYYSVFYNVFKGTWIACQAIHTGYVENDKNYRSDYLAKLLKETGNAIDKVSPAILKIMPHSLIGIGISLAGKTIKEVNARSKRHEVRRMARFFTSLGPNADKFILKLSKQLTLERAEELKNLATQLPKSLLEKGASKIHEFEEWLRANDRDDPVKYKARQDQKKLIASIMSGELTPPPALDQMITHILGHSPRTKFSEEHKSTLVRHTSGSDLTQGFDSRLDPDQPISNQELRQMILTLQTTMQIEYEKKLATVKNEIEQNTQAKIHTLTNQIQQLETAQIAQQREHKQQLAMIKQELTDQACDLEIRLKQKLATADADIQFWTNQLSEFEIQMSNLKNESEQKIAQAKHQLELQMLSFKNKIKDKIQEIKSQLDDLKDTMKPYVDLSLAARTDGTTEGAGSDNRKMIQSGFEKLHAKIGHDFAKLSTQFRALEEQVDGHSAQLENIRPTARAVHKRLKPSFFTQRNNSPSHSPTRSISPSSPRSESPVAFRSASPGGSPRSESPGAGVSRTQDFHNV